MNITFKTNISDFKSNISTSKVNAFVSLCGTMIKSTS